MDGLFRNTRSLSASGAINIGTGRRCFKGLSKNFFIARKIVCEADGARFSSIPTCEERLAQVRRLPNQGVRQCGQPVWSFPC